MEYNQVSGAIEAALNAISAEQRRLADIEKAQVARLVRLDKREAIIEARDARLRAATEDLSALEKALLREIDNGDRTDTERAYGEADGIRLAASRLNDKWFGG